MNEALAFLDGLPPWLVYAALAGGAAVENVLPMVPADTFIAAGGFLAGRGAIGVAGAFLVVWGFNAGGALAVYGLGRRHGPGFFRTKLGRRVATEDQMEALGRFYGRWGVAAIFASRFLPGFRALAPVFAGATGQAVLRVAPPVLVASALWYGALLRLGYLAGENMGEVAAVLGRTNRGLLAASAVLAVCLAAWWWRARRAARRGTAGRGPARPEETNGGPRDGARGEPGSVACAAELGAGADAGRGKGAAEAPDEAERERAGSPA